MPNKFPVYRPLTDKDRAEGRAALKRAAGKALGAVKKVGKKLGDIDRKMWSKFQRDC